MGACSSTSIPWSHYENELEQYVERFKEKLGPVRIALADPIWYADSCEAAGRGSGDLAIQEYRGRRVLRVIAIGETPVPLIRQQAKYHQVSGYARFLTLDVKSHAKSG